MNDRSPDPGGRDALRKLDRRIGSLLRSGPSVELARLGMTRVELLLEHGEGELALAQLGRVVEGLEAQGATEPELLARAYARRVRLVLDEDEEPGPKALVDVDRALELLREVEPPQLALRAELRIQRGRLLLELEEPAATEVARQAVAEVFALDEPNSLLLRTQALRELATALAADDELDEALDQLTRAQHVLKKLPNVPRSEKALLLSTHAELLANAGRLDEALVVLAGADDSEDWVLVQRAATFDLASRFDEARSTAARLVERLRERLDEEDLEACQQLAEVLLLQARREPEDERGTLAEEVLRLLGDFNSLPARSRRLVAHALELSASAGDDDLAHQALSRRAQLLEELVREEGVERDLVELIRTWMLDGDALLRLGNPWNARMRYGAVTRELGRLPDDHPAVQGILPLAHSAIAQALGASGIWLSAKESSDLAVSLISPDTSLATLAEMGELFLFRAIARINVGVPEDAVEGLGEDVQRLVDAIQNSDTAEVPAALVEVTVNAAVLQAEILVDHLDMVDEAAHSYDQALALCELAGVRPEIRGAIMGAKAAMLSERDRPVDALPLHEQSVALFQSHLAQGRGDLAFALVSLASTLNRTGAPRDALGKIQEAQALLQRTDESLDDVRREAIRSFLFHQRGEALLGVGHPLLAADEFTRSIEISRELLDDDGDSRFEARQRLPLSLLRRARCWLLASDHPREASADLREARRRYNGLYEDEGRPEHGRRLREVEVLERELGRGRG